ncbi:aconitate hydratase [candidate division LCP-89 bacterium B3_LCP]|uniref:Aconitate hydratase A n=1 Tax=candidate division LCP-89 bacterium B3_LCP TaxID=2012998 RepID=A0A532V5M9_UNCL8|nr:MAG: aconitate hydratase [candidate division LCP-89 bacterium B3_LCP]
MTLNLTQKIFQKHLVSGDLTPGSPIAIRIDQTLTQDATGTMAYLQFEALGIPKVKTELSVSYVDHNMLQSGFENADDHRFLQSIASRYGIYFSRPGNGICHQVHLERFGAPGKTLLGSDSHTPTCGGIGMIAMGAGGLDVALAMGGQAFNLRMPKVVGIKLTGKLQPFVSGKDVILEVLRRLTVKGGVGRVMEYYGEGVARLDVPDRATITNMGAELGATTSIFPSDKKTLKYLEAQGRDDVWIELKADEGCNYDEELHINLDELEPLVAKPHMPDNVVKVSEIAGLKVDQVAFGSCTNSSYRDLNVMAEMLKDKRIHQRLSAGLSPGSKQVMDEILHNGAMIPIVESGVRILESSCGACIGMGFSPPTEGITVRTFNRNFVGRTGTKNAKSYLVSPETAVACAITGEMTDPRTLALEPIKIDLPEKFRVDDSMIIPPSDELSKVEIIRGPNIKPLPLNKPLPDVLTGIVLLKTEDNITTDHIMPAGSKILPKRSNIPAISEHVFEVIDPTFPSRAKESGGGFVVGGQNYGQGSSREHAALAPMYLGLKAVLVKSFARIHLANLINFGILPLTFANEADYDKIDQGDELEISLQELDTGKLNVRNITKNADIPAVHPLNEREIEILRAGGALAYAKDKQ